MENTYLHVLFTVFDEVHYGSHWCLANDPDKRPTEWTEYQ